MERKYSYEFMHRKPSCFGDFVLVEQANVDRDFRSYKLHCCCGNKNLRVFSRFYSLYTSWSDPIKVECSRCNASQVIFDSNKHGWGSLCDIATTQPEEFEDKCLGEELDVQVEFSYQGGYEESALPDKAKNNPEDYFDVFSLKLCLPNGEHVASECWECD